MSRHTKEFFLFLGYILCCLSVCLTYISPFFQKEYFEEVAEISVFDLQPLGGDSSDSVDDNTADKDSSTDVGTETSFNNAQGTSKDSNYMNIQEADAGSSGVDEWVYVDGLSTAETIWTSGTTSPYLDAQDSDVISGTGNTGLSSWYTFGSTTASGSGCTVNLSVYHTSTSDSTINWYLDWTGDGTADAQGTFTTNWNTWEYTTTISGLDTETEINACRVQFDGDKGGGGPDALSIDCARLGISQAGSTNYNLDFEYNWTSATYTEDNEEVCIYYVEGSDLEDLNISYWNQTDVDHWTHIGFIDGTTGWYNFTAEGLDEAGYTIRINGTEEISDSTQNDYDIDCIFLHTWTEDVPEWVEQFSYYFTGGNISSDEERLSYYFTGGNISSDKEQFSYYFTGGNISQDTQRFSYYYTGGNVTNYEERFSHYFTGGNVTVNDQERFSYYFTGGNETLSYAQRFSHYFTGGNVTVYSEQFSHYFLGGNTTVSDTERFSYYYTGGNVSEDTERFSYYLTGGNISSDTEQFSYYFTGGNTSETKTWNQRYSYYYTGGNISNDEQQFNYYYTGGNISSDTERFSKYFTGGNVSSDKPRLNHYFTGGNTSNEVERFSYWFTGGNTSEGGWTRKSQYFFTGGNISSDTESFSHYFLGGNATLSYNQRYSNYFTGGNISTDDQRFSYYYTGGNISNNIQQYSYYFTGGNTTVDFTFGTPNIYNGSSTTEKIVIWSIEITYPTTFNWSINCSNGQNTNGTSDTSGVKNLSLTNLVEQTTYKVWVNATGSDNEKEWYLFTVIPNTVSGGSGTWRPPSEEETTTDETDTTPTVDNMILIVLIALGASIIIISLINKNKKRKIVKKISNNRKNKVKK